MSEVENTQGGVEVDLDAIGVTAAEPDHDAATTAREGLTERHGPGALGRLVDLAAWWAGVRADAAAPPPQRVRHLGVEVALPSAGEVDDALRWGLAAADTAADDGVDLVLLTVDDQLAGQLVAAELMGLDPVEANGWPEDADLDDETWMDQVLVLRDGLRRTAGLRGDLPALLRAVASPAMAGAAAFVVQAAVRRTPILLDGAGAGAAALLARRTAYSANQWWLAAHGETDQLHGRVLRSLQLEPLLSFGIRVEDGTAARLALDVLTRAAGLLRTTD